MNGDPKQMFRANVRPTNQLTESTNDCVILAARLQVENRSKPNNLLVEFGLEADLKPYPVPRDRGVLAKVAGRWKRQFGQQLLREQLLHRAAV
jgi:hypothetical protein